MVVYKKQLEITLMMGLWEPETCRVKIKEIIAQNKELHQLVTLLQYIDLYLPLQHSEVNGIHATRRNRTRNPSKLTDANPSHADRAATGTSTIRYNEANN